MKKINPPAQDDITTEHRDLYKSHSMKSVASYAGVHPSNLSRKLNVEEETKDHLYELLMELYASVMSKQEDIGRGLVRMVNAYANELGLLDEPISILEMATERLKGVGKHEMQEMSLERMNETLAAELGLEEQLKTFRADMVLAKAAKTPLRAVSNGYGNQENVR